MLEKVYNPEESVEERVSEVTPLPLLLENFYKVRETYAELSHRLNHLLYRLTGNAIQISAVLYDKSEVRLQDLEGQINCLYEQADYFREIINSLDEAI
jgi:hypothetical protein